MNGGLEMRASREQAGKEFARESQEPCKPKGPCSPCCSSERRWPQAAVGQGWRCRRGNVGLSAPALAAGTKMKKNGKHKETSFPATSSY